MKKKFFSKLLMGALLVATVSSYVSCKDYDDDIANLQSQIDKKATLEQIEALKSELASAKSDASSALAAAQASLEAKIDGKADKTALESAIAGVKAEAEAAGKETAAAIEAAANAAKNAQTTATDAANAAKAAADAAAAADKKIDEAAKAATEQMTKMSEELAKAATKDELAAEVKKIGETYATIATTNGLSDQIKALEEQVKTLVTASDNEKTLAALKECQDAVKAYEGAINALWSAVTSVSLYVAADANNNDVKNGEGHNLWPINFYSTTEVANTTFPDNEKKADNQFTFTKDKRSVIKDNYILIRVSPVNAVVTKEMIKLINSQGTEIPEELLKVTSVDRYESLLTAEVKTRAASNNGLWKVTVEVQDDYKQSTYDTAAGLDYKAVLYAVAVNNTKDIEAGAERAVISEYDLYLKKNNIGQYDEFTVNGTSIFDLHNRYWYTENGTKTAKEKGAAVDIPEYIWKKNNNGVRAPQATFSTSTAESRPTDESDYKVLDNRQAKPFLRAAVGEDIEIKFKGNEYGNIKGFYVTVDYAFAIESEPSELNAWNTYEYENVGTVAKDGTPIKAAHLFEGSEGTIKILSESANGDYIGFRVYAVNWDGTLCDPDGRAFYVQVGPELETPEMPTFSVLVEQAEDTYDIFAITGGDIFPAGANSWKWEWADANEDRLLAKDRNGWVYTNKGEDTVVDDKDDVVGDYTISSLFKFEYVEKLTDTWQDSPEKVANGNLTKVKFVKVTLKKEAIQAMIDNKTYTLILTARKKVSDGTPGTTDNTTVQDLAKITVNVQKLVPTGLPEGFTLKAGMTVTPLKVYVRPDSWDVTGKVTASYGTGATDKVEGYVYDIKPYDLTDIYNGLKNYDTNKYDEDYEFVFSSSDRVKPNNDWLDRATAATYGKQWLPVEDWTKSDKRGDEYTGLISNSYSVPFVNKDKLGGPKSVAVYYTYGKKVIDGGISVTEKSNGAPDKKAAVITRSVSDVFQVQYISALDLTRIKQVHQATNDDQWNTKAIYGEIAPSGVTVPVENKTATASEYKDMQDAFKNSTLVEYDKKEQVKYIKFKETLYWANPSVDNNALGLTNDGFDTKAGITKAWASSAGNNRGLHTLLADKYVKITKVETTNTFVKENFTIESTDQVPTGTTGVTEWGLKFTLKNSQADPSWDGNPIPATINITVEDVLGNKQVIPLELTFKVKLQSSARSL